MSKERGLDSERWKKLKWKKGDPKPGSGRMFHNSGWGRGQGITYNVGRNKQKRAMRTQPWKAGTKLYRLALLRGTQA